MRNLHDIPKEVVPTPDYSWVDVGTWDRIAVATRDLNNTFTDFTFNINIINDNFRFAAIDHMPPLTVNDITFRTILDV